MDIISHKNASNLYHRLGLVKESNTDFSLLYLPEIHNEFPFESPAFRSEYFSFIFISKGNGSYCIDDRNYEIGNYSIYFTNPGHLKSFSVKSCDHAFLLSFNEKFMHENGYVSLFSDFPFLLAEIYPPKKLSKREFNNYQLYVDLLYQEFSENALTQTPLIASLIQSLLQKMKANLWSDLSLNGSLAGDSLILQKFKQLVEKEYTKILNPKETYLPMQVQDYADQLNLHPNYLNSLIKSRTNKTVGDWLKDRTMSMAKMLLRNTQKSIEEISFILGYSETTHFSRFFKTKTGITPSQFRKAK